MGDADGPIKEQHPVPRLHTMSNARSPSSSYQHTTQQRRDQQVMHD